MSDNFNEYTNGSENNSNNENSNIEAEQTESSFAESYENFDFAPQSENFTPGGSDPSNSSGFETFTEAESSNDEADSTSAEQTAESENSYEWNADGSPQSSTGSEYHYSYINGNNSTADHNPNNYESGYSSYNAAADSSQNRDYSDYSSQYGGNFSSGGGYSSGSSYNYGQNYYSQSSFDGYPGSPYENQRGGYSREYSPYGSYGAQPYGDTGNVYGGNVSNVKKPKKVKKQKKQKAKKPVSRGFIAAALIITIIASAALGFGGGYLATKSGKSSSSDGTLNINKVDSSSATAENTSSSTASQIVKKTADSVVEITTESVSTGSFASQYVTQGAGSGVIISEDGYIITNNHVIEGANTVTVTLRDGTTEYNATLVGTDEENDIALIKIDAEGLSPATFGDSSTLAVGDYVIAIGNPLGELGGTVTDGIISALAREVTIENQDMTLLQTNAEINPGNSGGGLFNANGELVGIVNAKDSATEVEGIAFAIPINNVIDIIGDLKEYGYVTGKVDLGMEFTDITSSETAFYYGVNEVGCYVISVTSGSNAETAGFKTGDLIKQVNGTDVTTSSEIDKAIEDFEVGDTVKFVVSRRGVETTLELELAEYVPTVSSSSDSNGGSTVTDNDSSSGGSSIWDEMFGW